MFLIDYRIGRIDECYEQMNSVSDMRVNISSFVSIIIFILFFLCFGMYCNTRSRIVV